MPFSSFLLLIFGVATAAAIIGFTKNIKVLKFVSAVLFLAGVAGIVILIFALKSM